MEYKLTPALHRTFANKSTPGYWQYFELNSDGSYHLDNNGDYVWNPIWINTSTWEEAERQQNGRSRRNNRRNGRAN
jgi:hypothetical protein